MTRTSGISRILCAAGLLAIAGLPAGLAMAQPAPAPAAGDEEPKFKPFAEVSKGFEKVVSTADGKSFYSLWKRDRDGALLAEMPRGWEGQRHFVALTVASGEDYAGLQSGSIYAYWKRIDTRLVLIEPNVATRATGEAEVKSSVKNLFTDRVLLDVPIVTMGPSGQPVFDMKDLLATRAREVFAAAPGGTRTGRNLAGANTRLATLKQAKAFPQNIEVSYELPTAGGRLQEIHYSISLIPDNTGYTPRVADERVGYFTTVHRDLGKFTDREKWVRYINRWHLEKRDPKLKLSPPKEPIVFYIDTAVPVRYRNAVRDGVLRWNKAFEKVGITNAIEVYQQDEQTGAHMDKDAEDVRYNFVRWLANDQGTAIGPSRTHPLTGQILDADIILTDGWIRYFWGQFNEIMPELALEGMSPSTLAWLDTKPQWDPRVRLASPGERDAIIANRARRGIMAYGGSPLANATAGEPARLAGSNEFDGLANQNTQFNGLCLAARGKAFDLATMSMALDIMDAAALAKAFGVNDDDKAVEKKDDEKKDESKKDEGKKDDKKDDKKKEPKGDVFDGIPDWFVAPLLADLVSHEVGHTIGLRHNFKASGQYTWAEINSEAVKGKQAFTASIMDYTPVNFAIKDGKAQGDFAMVDIGKYDYWAIEYGYTTEDPKKVIARAAEPGLDYATDEDVGGPDPLARRYDFAKDPIEYAKNQMSLAEYHRGRLIDKFVKDGESWAKVRRGYETTLGMQTRALSMMSSWVGGAHINRDRKGDVGGRSPVQIIPAAQQRDALRWAIDHAFFDESFGLTPELRSKMTVDKWLDAGGGGAAMQEQTWPIHDRIGGIQASVLTMLMNPTTLGRVFDNEFASKADDDVLTLAEAMETIHTAVWSELEKSPSQTFTARKPMISSLRRNLQREYIDRLIDLTFPGSAFGEVSKPISNLATYRLRTLRDRVASIVDDKSKASKLDPYTMAHLSESKTRMDKALDAGYIINSGGGGFDLFSLMMMLGKQNEGADPAAPTFPAGHANPEYFYDSEK